MGYPRDRATYVQRIVCQEQLAHGDILFLNMRENHNDGKTYYAFKAVLEHVIPFSNYK